VNRGGRGAWTNDPVPNPPNAGNEYSTEEVSAGIKKQITAMPGTFVARTVALTRGAGPTEASAQRELR
jgi:hypothetical protein